MALVISDIHGNLAKMNAFIIYKPEEEHICAGDILDSFKASDEDILECFLNAIKNNMTLLWGNHCLHYLKARPFGCSGYRPGRGYTLLVEGAKHTLQAALLRDGYIITHAGVAPALNKKITNPQEMVDWINGEMANFLSTNELEISSPYTRGVAKLSPIFNIGDIRGGSHQFGGVFWLDWNYEKMDKQFNQIVGHTHSKECKEILNTKQGTKHIKVDADEFSCYNTYTHSFEDFFPEEHKKFRQQLEVLY